MIRFTIDGTSYQAEEGMTVGEWLSSSYNIDGYGDKLYGRYGRLDSTIVIVSDEDFYSSPVA